MYNNKICPDKNKMERKIKVLRIITRLNIGGPAIHTILLTEGLDRGRFESVLVTGTAEKSEGNMFYLTEGKDIRPIIIPELGRTLDIYKDIIAFRKLLCLIKQEKPDIIHTHTAKAGTLGRLAGFLYNLVSGYWLPLSNRKRCILIHTFHGHVLHSYFDKVKSVLFIWIERFLALFTAKIIAVSENSRKELIELKIAGFNKIVTVPLGLELERYLKVENDNPGNRDYKSVGIIGRLVPVKNHKMFLDAAKRLKESLGQKTKFLIVGDGPLRQQLESYVERLDIRQDVIFTGWVKDLEKIYSNLDIVALTSLNEGTPVALIEAQAAVRPCVATDVGGVADVIENGKSGFLVPLNDIDKFIEALSKLLNNPELALSMGKYGREIVKDKFSKSQLFKEIEHIYEELLLCQKTTL